jgi:hypothetical protein
MIKYGKLISFLVEKGKTKVREFYLKWELNIKRPPRYLIKQAHEVQPGYRHLE